MPKSKELLTPTSYHLTELNFYFSSSTIIVLPPFFLIFSIYKFPFYLPHNVYYVVDKKEIYMINLGNILKTLRLKSNMTQAQLAQKLGLTKSVISAYETGLRLPSYDILIHIAEIYNVSTDYLLGVEHKQEIDLSGLSQEEVTVVLNLIKVMKKNRVS